MRSVFDSKIRKSPRRRAEYVRAVSSYFTSRTVPQGYITVNGIKISDRQLAELVSEVILAEITSHTPIQRSGWSTLAKSLSISWKALTASRQSSTAFGQTGSVPAQTPAGPWKSRSLPGKRLSALARACSGFVFSCFNRQNTVPDLAQGPPGFTQPLPYLENSLQLSTPLPQLSRKESPGQGKNDEYECIIKIIKDIYGFKPLLRRPPPRQ